MTLTTWQVLLTVAAVAMLWPAFRVSRRNRGMGADEARLAVFRDRRRELDTDFASGKLDIEGYESAKRELEDAAALELPERLVDGVQGTFHHGPGTWVTVVVLVAGIGWLIYAQIGTPTPPVVDTMTHAMQMDPDGEFGLLIERLAKRMVENPGDLDGWMLLGRSRMAVGDGAGAIDAWQQARRLAPDDPTVLANLGEAMMLTDPEAVSGEGAELVEAALLADPDHPKALWYGGLLAAGRGDDELAALRWEALLALEPPQELRAMIEGQLREMGRGAESSRAAIEIEVSVSGALVDRVRPDTTVFIVARDPTRAGGPPLAAVRRGFVPDGLRLSMTDADTMLPGTTLFGHGSLVLSARLSEAGTADRQVGDLYGEVNWQLESSGPARIVIDRVLE